MYGGFNIIASRLFDSVPTVMSVSNRHLTGPATCLQPSGAFAKTGAWVLPQLVYSGAHALSNSFLDDELWAKVRFVRSEIPRIAALLPLDWAERASESAVVHNLPRILAAAGQLMGKSDPLTEAAIGDLSWSPLSFSEEAHLQTNLFQIPVLTRYPAMTVVLRFETPYPGAIFLAYCERSFDKEHCFALGSPSLAADVDRSESASPSDAKCQHLVVHSLDGSEWTVFLCHASTEDKKLSLDCVPMSTDGIRCDTDSSTTSNPLAVWYCQARGRSMMGTGSPDNVRSSLWAYW